MIYHKYLFIFLLVLGPVLHAQYNDADNRFRLAKSYEQAGDLTKAASIYESLFSEQPSNPQFFEALNRVYVQQKNFDASIRLIEERLKLSPQDITLYGQLGSVYFQKGEESKAFEIWQNTLNNYSSSPLTYRIIANHAIERRAFDKAIEYLTEGKKHSDEYFTFSFDLANLHSMLMHYRQAAEEYCFILSRAPEQLQFIQSRLASLVTRPEAYNELTETVKKWADKTENENFLVLLAWINTETGKYAEAYDLYIKIDTKRNNEGADLYNFAETALQDGFYGEASRAFGYIIKKYPNSPFASNAGIGYAKALEASLDSKYNTASSWNPYSPPPKDTEYQKVIEAYRKVIDMGNSKQSVEEASYRIGNITLKKLSDPDNAETILTDLTVNSPLSPFIIPAYGLLAEIGILKGNLEMADTYYEKIKNNQRSQPAEKYNALLMQAKLQFFQANYTGALSLLNDITGKLDDNSANDALELSLIISTSRNDSLSLNNFARAELLAAQYRFMEAADLYKELSAKDGLLTLKDLAEFRYAQMITARNDLPEAITLLNSVSADTDNIYADRALILLADIYRYGVKDDAKAEAAFEKLLSGFPNSLYLDYAREGINSIRRSKSGN